MLALLTLPCLPREPEQFQQKVMPLEAMDFKFTEFHVLDEMGVITARDLSNFLRRHKPNLGKELRDKIVEKIMQETGGHYEKVVEMLKDLDAIIDLIIREEQRNKTEPPIAGDDGL